MFDSVASDDSMSRSTDEDLGLSKRQDPVDTDK